jgi:hypothetical protein
MRQAAALVLSIVLMFSLCQWVIFDVQREEWFDSAFSLQTVDLINSGKLSFVGLRDFDVHPPVYYYLLAVWMDFQPSVFTEYQWAQELSVLLGLVFLFFAFFALRNYFGRAGSYAVVMLSMLSTYIHFATEPRMYMLILLLSAVILWAMSKGMKKVPGIIGCLAVMMLPLVHYLAVLVVPFYMFFWWVTEKDNPDRGGVLWAMFVFMCLGIAMAAFFAIPQRLRTAGTWFTAPSILSFPSAVFYSFWIVDAFASETSVFGIYLYRIFIFFLIGIACFGLYKLFRNQVRTKRQRALFVMGLSALVPLSAIVFLSIGKLLGGGAYWDLYHHRFFLGITWLFAAMTFTLLFTGMRRRLPHKRLSVRSVALCVWNFILITVVVSLCVLMLSFYAVGVHHELQRTIDSTPCQPVELADDGLYYPVTIWIGHESPFSSLPYERYQFEHNCNWKHFISTGISVKESHSAGFDAIPDQLVYWNLTLPSHGFYYVQSAAEVFNLSGRNYTVVAQQEGIRLLKVSPLLSTVNVSFG